MKKYRKFLYSGIALLLLFVVVSAFTFQRSKTLIQKGYLASEGNAAQNFAVLAAENTRLTDDQVSSLKEYNYDELMNSDENNSLKKMMNNDYFSNKVDYVYIMVHLDNSEVKYDVNEENQDRFDAPLGTKLDIMWLLDANVGTETSELQNNDEYDELSRYSYYIDEDALIFGESPTYIFNSSEWGDHICGYSPIYSESGKYIGVLGVELRTGDFSAYCDQAVFALGTLLVVSLLMLTLLFIYIYLRYRKVQYDKIYIDSLTQVYNRSYYNNRFIKRMNHHHSGGVFTLMIADVDWFKKVNDTFGHDIGDEVLAEIGEIMVGVFGKEHVVRFGGEEFVVGMWVNDENELPVMIDRLFGVIESKRFSRQQITLSVSLGCSFRKTESLDGWLLSGMLRAADCKLYEAKKNGRKRYYIEAFNEKKVYEKDTDSKKPI